MEGDVGDAVMDHVEFLRIDAVRVDQNALAGLREYDDRVGPLADTPSDRTMRLEWIGQDRMERHDGGLLELLEQVEKPHAVLAAEESILVLDVEDHPRVSVDFTRDATVRRAVVLVEA